MRFRHPDGGRLDLDYIKLASAGNSSQDLIVFLPADDISAAKLRDLAGQHDRTASRPPRVIAGLGDETIIRSE
jgi:hypothetical protein